MNGGTVDICRTMGSIHCREQLPTTERGTGMPTPVQTVHSADASAMNTLMTTVSWTPVVAALVTAVASLVVAVGTAVFARRAVAQTRRLQAVDRAQRYREPLLHAAYNLQSRFWNILHQNFLEDFLLNGTQRDKQYARLNTSYLIGQYLCWAEIIRDETQYLSPDRRRKERKLIRAMETVRHGFSDSQGLTNSTFRIFRGDQRAIGELLSVLGFESDTPRRRCIGYAAYVESQLTDGRMQSWTEPILTGIDTLASDLASNSERIRNIQHALVDLVNLVDPKGNSVVKADRSKA